MNLRRYIYAKRNSFAAVIVDEPASYDDTTESAPDIASQVTIEIGKKFFFFERAEMKKHEKQNVKLFFCPFSPLC